MGPLAKEGFKPFCALYSTFLQRGYDQVIHDIALMNLGVAFAIDRAGIVGEDGETHQGAFDISYLRAIPNMTLLAPYNQSSLIEVMHFARDYTRPCAFRYPRGAFIAEDGVSAPYIVGRSEWIREGTGPLLIGYGNGVGRAIETAQLLADLDPAILDLRFVKPLDADRLATLATIHDQWFVLSDSAKAGGVGSALLEFLADHAIVGVRVQSFEYEDAFIAHGSTLVVEESLGLRPEQIAQTIREHL
jgi:1-deoxy-D-xylulose-5-phosphate synthase